MKLKAFKSFCLLLTILLQSTLISSSHSQELSAIEKSPILRDKQVTIEVQRAIEQKIKKKISQNEALLATYLAKASGDPILEWLNARNISLPVIDNYRSGKGKFFRSLFKFKGEEFNIDCKVYIPKKDHRIEAEYGIAPEFAAFEPPVLKTDKITKLYVQGLPTSLFHHTSGQCSLLFKLSRVTFFNMQTDCKYKSQMLRTARQLNIRRLNRELMEEEN